MNPKDIALNWIEENKGRIISLSDTIWEYAELGLEEFKSSKLLADELEKHGFKVEMGIAGMPTAFVATWGSGKPIIGILGEYDALAGLSQKRVPWKEPIVEGAPGHGCGHNIFAAATVGGAIALKEAMEKGKLNGKIKYFGCPAEETLIGKVFMAREGVFKGLDFAINYHPSAFNTIHLGTTNAMNSAKFHFFGRASHAGGSPEFGRSALDAVELMNVGVNYLREHV
ncbi:MAG: amidohydrolase, partial [Candidatus Methanomethylicia archaeon]